MRRYITRKERRKRKKLIIISVVSVICLFSVGYSAFSSNFLVSGKGTIVAEPITIDQLKESKVTSGDGLYEDPYEKGKYLYKGSNPNNYIKFNNETWRIISVGSDNNLKIIRNESIGAMAWDSKGTRNSTSSTYCINASTYGCNAWSSTANLVGNPTVFALYYPNGDSNTYTKNYSGTVTANSSLNTYLNNDYYNNKIPNGINDIARKYIINYNFNVGTPGSPTDTETIETDVKQESLYKWNGKIGLINVTDVLKTTINDTCTSLNIGYSSNNIGNCNLNNWLWTKLETEWTISPCVYLTCSTVWVIHSDGYIRTDDNVSDSNREVRPVVYLKSDIQLRGYGTEKYPYTIVS